ncbi:MAG: acylphosphatase [Spirochaetota bacterium]
MEKSRQIRILLQGRVQMVGFRYFAVQQARQHNITGYVRNLSSGDVEIVAEGESEQLDAFLSAVKQGPPAARVDQCDVQQLTPESTHYTHFSIR